MALPTFCDNGSSSPSNPGGNDVENARKLTFGNAAKALLKDEGLTQHEVAERLGVTDASVSRLLADGGGSPSLRKMLSVLELTGSSLAIISNDAPLPEGCILLKEAKKEEDELGRDTEHASGEQAHE